MLAETPAQLVSLGGCLASEHSSCYKAQLNIRDATLAAEDVAVVVLLST